MIRFSFFFLRCFRLKATYASLSLSEPRLLRARMPPNRTTSDVFEIVGGTDYAFGACFISKVLDGGKGGGLLVGDRLLALGGQGLMYVSGAHACAPFAAFAPLRGSAFFYFLRRVVCGLGSRGGAAPNVT